MHIGQGMSVPAGDIIALIDLSQSLSEDTRSLLGGLRAQGRVRTLHTPARCLVLTATQAYLTGTGLRTLAQRAGLDQWKKGLQNG